MRPPIAPVRRALNPGPDGQPWLVDARSRIQVGAGPASRESAQQCARGLRNVEVASDPGNSAVDRDWGEPGLR